MTGVWLLVLGAIAAGSRWARAAMGAAIVAQGVVGVTEALRYGAPVELSFVLWFFVPMSLPLLPLVVLRVEQPREALALVALGRVREGWARAGGMSTILVAAALISLNHGTYALLVDLYRGAGPGALMELWFPAGLFALAAVAVRATSRRG
jgi:hypothetical protein